MKTLVLPGYGDSGDGHWQTRWEARDTAFERVAMPDWDHPVCSDWCDALDRTVAAHGTSPLLLAAHSLGSLTAVMWAAAAQRAGQDVRAKVAGALLVAVPDPRGRGFPADASGYDEVPMEPLPFPAIVVASSDDPYGSLDFTQRCAQAWGARFITIGPRGHINAESELGDWDEGRDWLASLVSG